ncbi:MAG: NAD(P)(+) transhydrogenase (Re/Si-specific) subunit beta, partial [Burkholderiales bacterium]|nr:NAD(P)(+) transhydrogenase (Re/Si-specific) subunit beta [Burkholderiales bacterium]
MSGNQVALWYLVASVLFILALKGLSHPESARRGNLFGMIGMAIAVVVTMAIVENRVMIILAIAIGGTIGAIVSRRVEMTQMPELVAAMHSLVGMAAVLIAITAVNNPAAFGIPDPMPAGNRLELFIGTFVGAITFSGSVIAFGKLAGLGRHFRLFSSAPVVFPGQHLLNLALALVMIGFGVAFFLAPDKAWVAFGVMTAIAFVLGVLIIIPIGGADMPV